MRLTQVFAVVAAIAALVAAFYTRAEKVKLEALLAASENYTIKQHTGDSPVMASGGSMTFRSAQWSCDNPGSTAHTKCVTTNAVPTSSIDWDFVDHPDGSFGAQGWTGLSTQWMLTIFARENSNNGGVILCTSSSNVIATATCSGTGYILIQVTGLGSNGGALNLVDSNAADTGFAVQYFDQGCNPHTKDQKQAACEHPKTILSSVDNQTYKCRHGNCRIAIGGD